MREDEYNDLVERRESLKSLYAKARGSKYEKRVRDDLDKVREQIKQAHHDRYSDNRQRKA